MFSSIFYNIKEGFKGIWRNRPMALASVSSVAASLFILGIIIILVLNINSFTLTMQNKFDKMQVYLEDGMDTQEIYDIKEDIESIDGVDSAEFESSKDAFVKLQKRWGKDAYLLEGMETSLQNSFIVNLESLESADAVFAQLKSLDGVEDIKYYKDVISKLVKISAWIRNIGLALIVLLSSVSLFVISNTIKIALYARRREINIMKYIGATNWFIRGPFLVEGMVLGGIGALASLGLISVCYKYIYIKLNSNSYWAMMSNVLSLDEIFSSLIIIFAVMGIGIGMLGSLISLKKHLEV
ncbi:cell-division protein FtsX [Peptoclostridium acidaminophilum DSM 3953]|uniref:Cell division protein FtsX n=1 Tax=Peptoclostridium acidaminophilum DSM 3953 TaxID=1286171 RepID=W8T4G4_PEPAC|nr:permease-like cell division protein FtsX [Peptoclostridium acidaminophilum]AHM55715.1 cell-division protein FtsX [Peptoclostridium acidaminophilum DSM 3953]